MTGNIKCVGCVIAEFGGTRRTAARLKGRLLIFVVIKTVVGAADIVITLELYRLTFCKIKSHVFVTQSFCEI